MLVGCQGAGVTLEFLDMRAHGGHPQRAWPRCALDRSGCSEPADEMKPLLSLSLKQFRL